MKEKGKRDYQNPKVEVQFYEVDVICGSTDPWMEDNYTESDFLVSGVF